jgi:hypothetical protein
MLCSMVLRAALQLFVECSPHEVYESPNPERHRLEAEGVRRNHQLLEYDNAFEQRRPCDNDAAIFFVEQEGLVRLDVVDSHGKCSLTTS